MFRLAVAVSLLISAVCAVAQNLPSSDPFAVSLAQKSVAALTGSGTVADVTLNGSVISILGSDTETGAGTFRTKGTSESRVDLSLSNATRSDVRDTANGAPGGAWEKNGSPAQSYAPHNCWTDAPWFFPALSSLAQTANPSFIFQYIGLEQHGGINTQHIRVFQTQGGVLLMQHLSAVDFYLDPVSSLPVAIAFQVHPDTDASTDIATEVRFANYQPVNGIQVPFHIQRMLDGGVVLDVTVTSATFNTGLPDSVFSLP